MSLHPRGPDSTDTPATPAPGNGQAADERFPPGHAWFVVDAEEDDAAMLFACERREPLENLLRHVEFNLRSRTITVVIEDVAVPVVAVMLRLIPDGGEAILFSAWINQLSPRASGILERLAGQSDLLIVLVDDNGKTVGSTLAHNVLVSPMENSRGWIANLAEMSPWTQPQFTAAKQYIRNQHPTNEDLWARFDEDSASEAQSREFEAVPA